MSFSSLPRPRLAKGEYILSARDLPILGYRKDGRPIYPIMGGSEPPEQKPEEKPEQKPEEKPQNQEPVEAVDEHGVSLGFPKDTEVSKMTDSQKANYWRNQSKVQQKRADELARQQQKPEQKPEQKPDQQQTPSREQIEAEIRADVSKDSALALLRTSLHTRGKNAEEIDDLIQYVSLDAFLTAEKKIDTAKVTTYLDRVAPAGSGGGGGGLPGQGRREQTPEDKAAAGKAEAERRGFTKASGTSTLLPKS